VIASYDAPGVESTYGVHLEVRFTTPQGPGMVAIDDPAHQWWFD
jgi:hypothetical protein